MGAQSFLGNSRSLHSQPNVETLGLIRLSLRDNALCGVCGSDSEPRVRTSTEDCATAPGPLSRPPAQGPRAHGQPRARPGPGPGGTVEISPMFQHWVTSPLFPFRPGGTADDRNRAPGGNRCHRSLDAAETQVGIREPVGLARVSSVPPGRRVFLWLAPNDESLGFGSDVPPGQWPPQPAIPATPASANAWLPAQRDHFRWLTRRRLCA